MIDLHCHVLPGIDDGPQTLEDSLALSRAAAAAGIATIVATPHVDYEYPDVNAELIAQKVQEVRGALSDAGIAVEVVPGAEIALTRALELSDEELHGLQLGGGGWVLVEAPLSVSARQVTPMLRRIAERGHRIVIGHPERSPFFQRRPDALAELIADGMLSQITASSLTGVFGTAPRELAMQFLSRGLVHVVASDAHDAVHRRPSIAAELQQAGFAEQTAALASSGPAEILVGRRPDPIRPLKPPARRGWPAMLGRVGLGRQGLRPT